MPFATGSLVRARGREWLVLPESDPAAHLLVLRPLGGSDDEVAGLDTRLEPVEPATFAPPDPARELGNHRALTLLRDAVRLGFRAGAGPFRSLARIAVEPRPYQLVPLLMALRQPTVRLLVADDVGVGKTIEACLIARELLDRGEVLRTAVLCPPHLAEQWQRALQQQFHIDAALVLAGTAARLERRCAPGQSLFERHPHVVVSLDFIKSERRRHEFLRVCPELVIVDEAHTCAAGAGASQRRHDLLRELARDAERHLILVTATPHSGDESQFRSLLTLLDPALAELPQDLSGDAHRRDRERLATYLVQRRRGDLTAYLGAESRFPVRETSERTYLLTPAYRRFVDRALAYCRERVRDTEGSRHRQRIRWWSALALLRSLASSPAAAAATLRNRAASADTDDADEADVVGRRSVLDLEADSAETLDVAPGTATEEGDEHPERRRLLDLAREAEKLAGSDDAKLARAAEVVDELLKAGHSPIVFCRFIPTVAYLAGHLRKRLKDVHVEEITGELPPEEREDRVDGLDQHERRVLVCTDCLSEGINLQDLFDAVVHYDLSWNPTRHEQREGRVDRYGQPNPQVRAVTLYGKDNPVDGIVLDVLLRKHQAIRSQLGISVPVPMDTDAVVDAIFEGLLLRSDASTDQINFDFAEPQRREVELVWERAREREKRSRSVFAQASIDVAEVAAELDAVREAIGAAPDVERFVRTALAGLGAHLTTLPKGQLQVSGLRQLPSGLRDALGAQTDLTAVFQPPAPRGAQVLTRTSPLVEGLAGFVLETALDAARVGDPRFAESARRCAALRTAAVQSRTALYLLRLRFHLVHRGPDGQLHELLAEDTALCGLSNFASAPERLAADDLHALLNAEPSGNIAADLARTNVQRALAPLPNDLFAIVAREHGEALLAAHRRVRKAAGLALRALKVEPHPPDLLALCVYLPPAPT
ncbi:helicase-related protein [Nannocystis pusilla]|uniref:DEAD/DEAH box helicase n=1 Tax=Nannocystis pusilla TaxID=889268 RepID=A0ABS7TMK4_9BACT|nr:helicase-related protein [Nannocystis pusilla]MBZ5709321.1 DEAD/DEAH box helicase [Nannocystis pusilla]